MIYRLLGSLALLAASCFGSPIYFWVNDAAGNLGEVNLATGGVTMVGNAGVVLTDIAFSPTGALYGITATSLYTINTSTGVATLTGSLGSGISTANALAFSSNGTLYAADSRNLYSINLATGLATDVGAMGFGSNGDLAFVGGTLYLSTFSGQLVIVNTSTGASKLVGSVGVVNVYGLASPDNVHLYGVAGESLYSMNLTTGAATLDATWAGDPQGLGVAYGMAFDPVWADPASDPTDPPADPPTDPPAAPTVASTPEPGTLTLFGVGCLLLALGSRLRSAAASAPVQQRHASQRQLSD